MEHSRPAYNYDDDEACDGVCRQCADRRTCNFNEENDKKGGQA